ncbi:50S ribosomal protein L3 [Acidobacteriota bacterium]
MTGILGKKIGMTHIFTDDAKQLGVTVIEAGPCLVLSVKEKNIQIGFDNVKEKSLNNALLGYFKKISAKPLKIIREVSRDSKKEYKVGQELKADIFKVGDFVDVTGTSIGKGFQGGVKRWHWKGGPASHGSMSHRRIGSTGSSATPSRVLKGHHQAGHMGAARVTVQNLKVVKVDTENNLLLVEGAVPGSKNGYLIIRKAKKKKSSD